MQYITVTQLETANPTSVKVKGLPATAAETLKKILLGKNIFTSTNENFLEADMEGFEMLNILAKQNYTVCGQSMAIEENGIGGRTMHILNLTWTLIKRLDTE